MSNAGKEPERPSALEGVQKKTTSIKLSAIETDPDAYSFRASDDLTESRLGDLLEDVRIHRGIHQPLIVKELPDDKYLLFEGHRRRAVLEILAQQKVEGFDPDMLVPVVVVPADISELSMLSILASVNIQRETLDAEGRQRLAYRLHCEGMPKEQNARLLGVSPATVDRAVTLESDPKMMEHVKLNHLGGTDAARIVKLARDKGRYDEFMDEVFEPRVEREQRRLEQEVEELAEQDEVSQQPIEKWPPRQFGKEQIDSWIESLRNGTPFVEPSFRYRALLKSEKGQQRIVVDSLDVDVSELKAQHVAKLYVRFSTLAAKLEGVVQRKAKIEDEVPEADESERSDDPAVQRLKEMGLGHLVADTVELEETEASGGEGGEGDENAPGTSAPA
jgi:predicted transcriptional regulator